MARIAFATLLVAGMAATPAAAMPAGRDADPRIVSVSLEWDGPRALLEVVGRDRDDVVRGVEVSWGDGQPAQGLSACTIRSDGRAERRGRGKRQRFVVSHAFPAAGDHAVTVRVLSGGCGGRPQQLSEPRTLTARAR